ncbi:MAG: restriction endonuclease subunit S [Gammaproteobacteria bacterium]|nr:restriction endonuclease subunit S [Gammaproteobacteria bacterium]
MIAGLRPYPAYRDSGVEWLGTIPSHWISQPGRAFYAEKNIPNSGLRESTVLSLSYGRLVVKPPHTLHGLVPASFETYQIVEPGDIVVRPTDLQNDWSSLRFALAKTLGIITSAYMCFQTTGTMTREYGHLLLHCYDLKKVFYGLGSGLRQNLDWGDFKYLPCICPPSTEQAAIVRFLDDADRRIQRAITLKEKRIALLEEQKQAIVQQAVTGQIDVQTGKPFPAYKDSGATWLGRVPEPWTVVALRRVTRSRCDGPFGSGLKSSHYTTNGVRVVRLQNIGHGEFKEENATYVSEEHCAALGDHSVATGDLLIAGLGDNRHPSGRACVAPATILPAMVKADCFRFRLDTDCVDPQFVAHQLTATAAGASNFLSTGATRQRTNLQTTATRAISFPGIAEQALIVESITYSTSGIRSAADAAHRQIKHLNEYRARLISDVVTGKLDVRNAAAALPETPAA